MQQSLRLRFAYSTNDACPSPNFWRVFMTALQRMRTTGYCDGDRFVRVSVESWHTDGDSGHWMAESFDVSALMVERQRLEFFISQSVKQRAMEGEMVQVEWRRPIPANA